MSRILLVLARKTYRAEAFLTAAARLGIDVVVASDHRAALRGLAPGRMVTVDLADAARSIPVIRSAARVHPVDAVIAAEDEGVVLAAEASAALGLRHASPAAVGVARDKAALRSRMAAAGLPVPAFTVVEPDEPSSSAAERVPYPCVVKPLSLSASRGVIRADDPASFIEALGRSRAIAAGVGATPGARILVESFLPGREVALEGVLVGGRLTTLALLDKPDPLDGPYFEETMLVTPSRLAPDVQAAVATQVRATAEAIGLDEGPVHAELRVDGSRVRLLELAPRSIGGKCSRLFRFEGGTTLEEVILAAATGSHAAARLERGASGVLMLPIPGRGILEEVAGRARARMVPHVEDLEITIPAGAEVVPPPEGGAYLGFVFARAGTPARVEHALREAQAHIEVRIDPSRAGLPRTSTRA